MAKQKNINDNVHGLIRITHIESRIMSQEIFNRLHNVYQNSVAYLTWPSNRNQRFEHSIGTMKLAGDMFFHSIENAESDVLNDFLTGISEEILTILEGLKGKALEGVVGKERAAVLIEAVREAWRERRSFFGNEQSVEEGEVCPLPIYDSFLIPSNIEKQHRSTCYLVAEAVRVAGMLHDIGHPPFSHAVEKSLVDLYNEVQSSAYNKRKRAFKEALGGLYDKARMNDSSDSSEGKKTSDSAMRHAEKKEHDRKLLHEVIGDNLTALLFAQVVDDVLGDRLDRQQPLLALEFYVIGEMVKKIFGEKGGLFRCLHQIIDSTVDADRLDFVKRDSLSSGFGIGAVPYSQIIDSMKLVKRKDDEFVFAFSLKSSTSIATFLRQRYQNYDTIVFHHHVVKTEELLRQVVMTLGKKYLEEALVREKDRGEDLSATKGGRLPDDISGLWEPFVVGDTYGQKHQVRLFGQWNDAWFVSMLTGEYIARNRKALEESKEDAHNNLLLVQLASLLYGRRGYVSLIKRYEHIKVINDAFLEAAKNNIGELDLSRPQIENKNEDKSKGNKKIEASPAESLFEELLLGIKEGDSSNHEFAEEPNPSQILSILSRDYTGFLTEEKAAPSSFVGLVRQIVEEYMKEHFQSKRRGVSQKEDINRVLVVSRKLDSGISKEMYLYDPDYPSKDGDSLSFDEYSNIRTSIAIEERMRPQFFIFVYFSEDEEEGAIKAAKSDMLQYLGKKLFQWFLERYKSFLAQVC